jgi:iron complex outermembrane receptor protein
MNKKIKLLTCSTYLAVALLSSGPVVLAEHNGDTTSQQKPQQNSQQHTVVGHQHERGDSVRDREVRALTEITITADPFSPTLLEYGSPVSVLEKGQILLRAEPTIGETISNEPGVSSSYFGPGASRPVIRGNAGERVRVLKNGVGSQDVSNTSEDHAVSINPLAAESIEILRGPETLLFGSSAIGGVVNVTDNSIPEVEVGKPLTGSFDYRQGTADDELTGAVKLEGQVEKFNWHLDYFHQDTNDIDIPGLAESDALRAQEAEEGESHEETISNGTLADSDTRNQGFTVGGSYVFAKGFIGASVNGWRSNYGVPGHSHAHEHEEHGHDDHEDEHGEDEHLVGEHEDEHGEDEHLVGEHEEGEGGVAIDAQQLRVDVRGKIKDVSSAIESVKFKLGLSTYEHDEVEGGGVGTSYQQDAVEGRMEFAHTPIGSFEGIIGMQIQASDFSAIGEESFIPQVDTFSPALFMFEEVPLSENLKLQAGFRYDYVNYDTDAFSSSDFHPIGLSTGLIIDPTGDSAYTIGVSAAFTQRAPAATELYADGAHIARSIFERGDPDLGEEKSYGLDITFKKNTGLLTGELNLFAQDYDDYINLGASGEEEAGLSVYRYKAVDALFWGVEVEGMLHLHEALDLWSHNLDLVAQVDYVRAKNRTDSEDLPRIPPLRTVVGLEYAYKRHFIADVEGIFVAKQNDIAERELPTDAYHLLNASVQYNLQFRDRHELALYVRGTNLTDEEARVHSSFIKDLAPLRGRSLLFGVRGVF